MKILWSVTVLTLLLAISTHAETQDVTFNGPDGFTLKGTFSSPDKPGPGPGILLLHQCDANRHVYDHLATLLNNAGYNVLAFDFRGSGDSKGGETAQHQKIMGQMPGDIDAALTFLASRNTVNPRILGIVAGNCAVNQAVHAGRRHPEIRTLVLLSGGTDAEGEAYIKDSSAVPILGVASSEDSSAAAAIKKLVALSGNDESQIEMLTNAGHAAAILTKDPDIEPEIVVWFVSHMPIRGYALLPPAIK